MQRRVFALQIGFRLETEDDDEKKVSELQEEGPFILVYTILHFSPTRGISEPDYFSYQDVKNVPFLRKVLGCPFYLRRGPKSGQTESAES